MKSTDRAKLEEFIVTMVVKNKTVTVEGSGPVKQSLSAQQLLHANTSTLENFHTWLQAKPATVGSTRRGTAKKYYVEDVATREEVMDIVDIILADRDERAKANAINAERKQLEAELEGLETPEERKDKIRKKLAALNTEG